MLDLPGVATAFGRRLRSAGLPVTPARSAEFARALELVRPVARRRLYWTARGVFVTDSSQVKAFDRVFLQVFGEQQAEEDRAPATEEAPRSTHERDASTASDASDAGEEIEVPVAQASAAERLATKSFDSLEPHELAQLYRLMSRLKLATPLRRTRRYEEGRHGGRIDMRRTLRGSLRTGGDPIGLKRRRRRTVRRRLVMLCDISGSMEPYARAYLQFLTS